MSVNDPPISKWIKEDLFDSEWDIIHREPFDPESRVTTLVASRKI